jgi:hypothetical protein
MRPRLHFYLLLALILFFGCSSLLWLSRNSRPPGTAGEIRAALQYSRPIASLSCSGFRRVFLDRSLTWYAPAEFILIGIQFAITRPSVDWAAAANIFWLVVFCLASFTLSRRFLTPETGLLAIALTLTMNIVVALVREVSLEIALMATVTLSVYLLLRTEHFTQWKPTILLGLVAALGLLVKESFPLYLFFPSLFVFLGRPSSLSGKTAARALVGMALCLGIAAFWYVPHWVNVRELYELNRQQAVIEGDPVGWNLAAALYYPNALVNYYLHPLLALLLLASLVQNWRRALPAKQVLTVWLLGTYFLLTFIIANKDVRHFVPCAPAIGFLVADWLLTRRAVIRNFLTVAVLVISCVYFFSSQWGIPRWDRVIHYQAAQYDWRLWDGALFKETVPHRENWNIPELIHEIEQDAVDGKLSSSVRVGVVPFVYRYNNGTLQLYAALQNFDGEFVSLGNETNFSTLSTFDYLITKSGDQGAASLTTQSAAINEHLVSNPLFKPLGSFPLFDGTTVTVLKNTKR